MSMLRELEKLLREISEPRPAQAAKPAAQPARAPVLAQPVEAEIIEGEPVHDWRRDTADQPIHRLDTDDITQHASQLGAKVGMADEKLEARIHSKFDHDLSHLDEIYGDKKDSDEPTEGSAASGDIAEMLRNPQSVRQAIILSEILKRPLDRW